MSYIVRRGHVQTTFNITGIFGGGVNFYFKGKFASQRKLYVSIFSLQCTK